MKQTTISIETARAMYERGGTAKEFALENFTETELQKPSYPKQTAVEWLVEEIHKNGNWIPTHMIEQAKQMEKEQIEMACNQQEFEDIDGLGICETISKGEQYYNETYGETKN